MINYITMIGQWGTPPRLKPRYATVWEGEIYPT